MPNNRLLALPNFLEKESKTIELKFSLWCLLRPLTFIDFLDGDVVVVIGWFARDVLDGDTKIFFLDVFVKYCGKQFVAGVSEFMHYSLFLSPFGDAIYVHQEHQNAVLILNAQVFEHYLWGLILFLALKLLHLWKLDIVDALPNPFIPIHAAVGVELDAPQLKGYILVVEDWVSGKEVKVKRICL